MKKIIIALLPISIWLSACSSGSSGSTSTLTPPQVTATSMNDLPTGIYISGNYNPVFYKFNADFAESYTIYFPNPNKTYMTTSGPSIAESSPGVGAYVTPDQKVVLMSVSGREYLRDAIDGSYTRYDFSGYNKLKTSQTSQPFAVYLGADGIVNMATGTYVQNGGVVTATSNSAATPISTPFNNCSTTAISTTALHPIETNHGRYLAVGTSSGDICFLGITGPGINSIQNLTSSQPTYNSNSPVFGIVSSLTANSDYIYWYNQNGQIWQAVYTTDNQLQSFVQVNGSNYNNSPEASENNITAIYSDKNGNLYTGTNTGKIYVLIPGYNSWTSIQLQSSTGVDDTAPVQAISTSLNGGVFATTMSGKTYTLAF